MKTNVSKWRTALAVTVGGVMLATSAMAQTGVGTRPASNPDTTKSDAPKADTTKSDAPKADTTKSDAPKAEMTKSPSAPGAATGTAAGETKSEATSGDRQQVKAVQQALKDKGHDPGKVDGAMGPKTEAALRDYQQKEGLKATGTADAETMAKLTAAVSPPSKAASSDTGASKDPSAGDKQKQTK